jgi:hypothetical protein
MARWWQIALLGMSFMLSAEGIAISSESKPKESTDAWGEINEQQLAPPPAQGLELIREQIRFEITDQAWVYANYEIHNSGELEKLNLAFLSANMKQPRVVLDGQELNLRELTAQDFDRLIAHQAEGTTQAFSEKVMLSQATFGPGNHRLEISYSMMFTYLENDGPLMKKFMSYSFSPSTMWGRFGTVDIEVNVPKEIDVLSSLPLRRQGNKLLGHFNGLPARMMTMELCPPQPTFWSKSLWYAGLFVGWVVTSWLMVSAGVSLHQGQRKMGRLLKMIAVCCLGAVPVVYLQSWVFGRVLGGSGSWPIHPLYQPFANSWFLVGASVVLTGIVAGLSLIIGWTAGRWAQLRKLQSVPEANLVP